MEKLEINNLLTQLEIVKNISSEKNSIKYRVQDKASNLYAICDNLTSDEGFVKIPTADFKELHTFLSRLKNVNSWEYIDKYIEESEKKINLWNDMLKLLTQK